MILECLPMNLTVCKLREMKAVDFAQSFVFVAKTAEELSLVCETEKIPGGVIEKESGWRALKIVGMLDFGLVGIIAKITSILAAQSIAVFVVSTFNTDYVLIKEASLATAVESLRAQGYTCLGR